MWIVIAQISLGYNVFKLDYEYRVRCMSHNESWINTNFHHDWMYMSVSPLDSVNCKFFKGQSSMFAILLTILTLFLVHSKHVKSEENEEPVTCPKIHYKVMNRIKARIHVNIFLVWTHPSAWPPPAILTHTCTHIHTCIFSLSHPYTLMQIL